MGKRHFGLPFLQKLDKLAFQNGRVLHLKMAKGWSFWVCVFSDLSGWSRVFFWLILTLRTAQTWQHGSTGTVWNLVSFQWDFAEFAVILTGSPGWQGWKNDSDDIPMTRSSRSSFLIIDDNWWYWCQEFWEVWDVWNSSLGMAGMAGMAGMVRVLRSSQAWKEVATWRAETARLYQTLLLCKRM